MRLWHKNLLSVLPEKQLIAQWRELSAIASNIKNKGTPNHILVNPIMDYELDHFITYAFLVKLNLYQRGYRPNVSVWEKIKSLKPNYKMIPYENLFNGWHTYRYFLQCYFNLEEKYDRGGISEKDYDEIHKLYCRFFENESCTKLDKLVDKLYSLEKENKLC